MDLKEENISDQLIYDLSHQNTPRFPRRKQKHIEHTIKACLQEISYPPTPPHVKQFRSTVRAGPGAVRRPLCRVTDPEVIKVMVHGVRSGSTDSDNDLIFPPEKSLFQRKLNELNESVYASSKVLLGRTPAPFSEFPDWINEGTTFGDKVVREYEMAEVLFPPKTAEDLALEAVNIGRFDFSEVHKDKTFGDPTPHCNDGRYTAKTVHWLGEPHKFHNPNPAWKRSGNKEKLALETGNPSLIRGRRKSPLPVPPDHIFGDACPADPCGAGDLLHNAEPGTFIRGPDWERSAIGAARHFLKRVNFNNFSCLLQAFKYYDKKGRGLIDRADLWTVCREFNLTLNGKLLDGLMEYCDVDKDGFLNFVEFANFLTYKDIMPIHETYFGLPPISMNTKIASDLPKFVPSLALYGPHDLEPVEPGSSKHTIRTIRRPRPDLDFVSSSSDELPTPSGRTYGIPSIRYDLLPPLVRRISDKTDYGDLATLPELLHPSVPDLYGVDAKHYFGPRTKQEIEEIFRNIGVNISDETFEEAWKLASMKKPSGEVCVEHFRQTLKELNAI
ncbi:EF-hand domain-containing family member B isoform X2 [Gambusia affinis]|uniref:EF-hand domain-containing family member B isoform X2 n=1 Tax=Gambusia affinis TaxID=33528 RepID=UPI001CDCDBB0|nr:EF-hand domain-containing family member B isoform X2 [Gambusia affinis]